VNYFVTGGTGFIGRFLVERLLARGGRVHLLVRKSSAEKLDGLRERVGGTAENVVPVWGDLTTPALTDEAARRALAGRIDHVFHLAAVYDMGMNDETADRVNNEGTRNVVAFANELGGGVRFHHVSSVAIAGADYRGTFTEEMFDVGQRLSHPYYRTKFQSEAIVRGEAKVPWRIYRPGMVVGSSETGEIDKIDGPYYFFPAIKRIGETVPKWIPILGFDGGRMPIAPVDYVAAAMDHIAHEKGLDGRAFFLLQSDSPKVADVVRIFLRVAHGPGPAANVDVRKIPGLASARRLVRQMPLSGAVQKQISRAIGIPLSVFGYMFNRTRFDDSGARAALAGSGISCPPLADYAEKLWSYWDLHLNHDVEISPRAARRIAGKVVMVTGASSGIGQTLARKLGAAGATVVLVARSVEKLEETKKLIESRGGKAVSRSCDLNDMDAIDACADSVLAELGHVDVLINNAGRSIRRSVYESLDRFHDFERTMRLNYFGAVRLILRLLPSMSARKSGHIVNVSSVGCLANVPRFSAYVASKSALDAFSRCVSAEVRSDKIEITTVYMPLVRTPMIAPTKIYDYFPTLSSDQAADMLVKAIVERPKSMASALGTTAQVSYALWPRLNDFILNQGFHLFPSSAAARGKASADGEVRPSREGIAFANLFRGLHW
jgi:NAD(P)-dependent dehydrogenase (short-subunit alcohol dehydrogenase family)